MGGANETRAARLTLGAVSRGAAGVTTARDLLAPVVAMAGAATAPALARGREVGGANDTRVARLTLARLTLALVGATSAREEGVVKVVAATTGAAASFLITSGNLR